MCICPNPLSVWCRLRVSKTMVSFGAELLKRVGGGAHMVL